MRLEVGGAGGTTTIGKDTAGLHYGRAVNHAGPLKAVGGLDAADSVSRICVPARRRRGVKVTRLRKRALDVPKHLQRASATEPLPGP